MVSGAQKRITETLLSWPGVTAQPHRFGGVEYVIGKREIGHIHGDRWVDIPFPTRVRHELVDQGLAEPHHILPDSGWITFRIRRPEDVDEAILLFQRSYDIATWQKQSRKKE